MCLACDLSIPRRYLLPQADADLLLLAGWAAVTFVSLALKEGAEGILGFFLYLIASMFGVFIYGTYRFWIFWWTFFN